MANQINEQIWRNLELLIKCQECDGKLTEPVYMCGSGHSICNACTNKGAVCTQCHAPYTKIPNLLLQNLLSQFDNLKVYLKELKNKSEQSHNLITTVKNNSNNSSDPKHVNKYRCWIGNDCRFIADLSTIVHHFKNNHIDQFEEHLKWNFPFKKSYEMNYAIGNSLDCGIKIGRLVFIIHISINEKGELGSCILMYATREITNQYKFLIQVECDKLNSGFRQAEIVNASNSPERVNLGFKRFGLHIGPNVQLYKLLDKNKRFKCTVMIEKKSQIATDEKKPTGNIRKFIPKANNKSKKNHESKAKDDMSAYAVVPVEVSEPLSGFAERFHNKSNVDDPACVLM